MDDDKSVNDYGLTTAVAKAQQPAGGPCLQGGRGRVGGDGEDPLQHTARAARRHEARARLRGPGADGRLD